MTEVTSSFDYIRDLVRNETSIVLEEGREYLVESRLLPVAKAAKLADVDELVARLKLGRDPELKRDTLEAMTTNETSFFRDVRYFDALRNSVVPDLIEKRNTSRRVSIWSAASSSGQEVYSLCMLLRELSATGPSHQFDILATDYCDKMIKRVSDGEYTQLEVNRGLPANLLVKYFERNSRNWKIKDDLRNMVKVRQLNLTSMWTGITGVDLLMMRNVLIYFDVPTKKAILQQVRRVLAPDGYLVLGGAETTINIDDQFSRHDVNGVIFYQMKRGA